jgi:hypothetical protein
MSGLDSSYLNDVQKHLGYFGIFPPNRPVKLGDYGKRQGDEWERHGNISKWIEPKEQRRDGGPMTFTSDGDVKTQLKVGAKDPTGQYDVDLDLTFTKKHSIFFQAHRTTIVSISNLQRVGERIVQEYQEKGNDWQLSDEWVNELVLCDVLTVIVASESGQQVTLRGKAPVNVSGVPVAQIDLEKFSIAKSSSGMSITGPIKGATPLFKLYRVNDSAFKKADYAEVR